MRKIFFILFFIPVFLRAQSDMPLSATGNSMALSVSGSNMTLTNAIDNSTYLLTLVPDYERMTVSVTGGQMTIGRMATSADVGKTVAVKNARYVSTYRASYMAWRGIVTGIANGKLVLGSGYFGDSINQLQNVNSVECEIGTNQWDDINNAISFTKQAGKYKLLFNWTGTVLVNPLLSVQQRAEMSANNGRTGWIVAGVDSFQVSGLDSSLTKLKYTSEDEPGYSGGFSAGYYCWGYGCKLDIRKLTFIAPDRASTSNGSNIHFATGVTTYRGIYVRQCQVLSPDINYGWDQFINEDNTIAVGYGYNGKRLQVVCENCKVQASYGFTVFSQNYNTTTTEGAKELIVRNVRYSGGGVESAFYPIRIALQLILLVQNQH